MSPIRRSKRIRDIASDDSQGPSSSSSRSTRARPPKESKSEIENPSQMDDTVDYAALVNNYLADERLAQQMQREENQREDTSRSNSTNSIHNRLMASVSRMRSNEPIEISDDDSDENEDQLDRENDSFDDLFGDSDDDENMYVDSDIPQRRSAVLAPVRVHVDNNMRVSVAINGTRNSVNSILNAQMAARNVAAADLARQRVSVEIPYGEFNLSRGRLNRIMNGLMSDSQLFDVSMQDEPTGLSDAQINRLPRTQPTQTQIQSSTTCSVCMDAFEEGVDLLTLPCFHVFHYDCIKPWFQTKHDCPVCRQDVRQTGSQMG